MKKLLNYINKQLNIYARQKANAYIYRHKEKLLYCN